MSEITRAMLIAKVDALDQTLQVNTLASVLAQFEDQRVIERAL
jgi:hypothetical protein